MLLKGGDVGPGSYERRNKNVVMSAGLRARNSFTSEVMRANCSLRDKCLPNSMGRGALGAPVPGSPGKIYTDCTDEEASRRLMDARECASRNLATKGGIYSSKIV
jgi:hypothetical protein